MKFPKAILPNSHEKETWICDCGKEKLINIYSVISGNTTSCGRCNEISQEEMSIRKFGKLRMKFPKSVLSGSNKKEIFICDCGKETLARICHIISGLISSCGRCNEISLEEMASRKFGKLRMKFPKAILPNSHKKETWICDCGKEKEIKINFVISGESSSCGRCNEISAEEMKIHKFGKLRMKFPRAILPGSNKKETWICDCGKENKISIHSVVSGNTKSCGNCRDAIYRWYTDNVERLRLLKCPIDQAMFPPNGPTPLEVIKRSQSIFKCQCVVCGKVYYPRLHDIKQGKSLTCGCTAYRISSGQKETSQFIESLGFKTEFEYKVNGLSYDIFVPSVNLLIEYDGKRWHSMKGSKERDLRKEENATRFRYGFFRITEDEWVKNREKVEDQLKSIVLL